MYLHIVQSLGLATTAWLSPPFFPKSSMSNTCIGHIDWCVIEVCGEKKRSEKKRMGYEERIWEKKMEGEGREGNGRGREENNREFREEEIWGEGERRKGSESEIRDGWRRAG